MALALPLDLVNTPPCDSGFRVVSVTADGGENRMGTMAVVSCEYTANGKVQKPRVLQARTQDHTCFPIRKSESSNKFSFGMVVKNESTLHQLVREVYAGALDCLVKDAASLAPTQAVAALESVGGGEFKDRFAKKKKPADRQKVARELLRELSDEQRHEYDEAVRAELKSVFVLVKERQQQAAMLSPSSRDESDDYIVNADVYTKSVDSDGVPTFEAILKQKVGDNKPETMDTKTAWETVGNAGRVKVFTASTVVLKLKKMFIKSSGDMISLGWSLSYLTAQSEEAMDYDPDDNCYKPKSKKARLSPEAEAGASAPAEEAPAEDEEEEIPEFD